MRGSLIIKGLTPGLTETGKIKIGEKGRTITSARGATFQPPQKLDHFRVTTLERGVDGNYMTDQAVHRMYGDKPRSLPVRLLYDEIDLNFQCRYTCFRGRSLWCSGDGETAERVNGTAQEVPCPCGKQDPSYTGDDKCKINSRLSVLIDGMDRVGGVWVLRSTSYNTTVGILSSLALIKRITGGPLAGLPLELTLNPKTAITPDGKTQNIWVVGLQFSGSVEQLQQIGLEQAKRDAIHYARIERIEHEARALLAHDPVMLQVETDDVVEEFFPEQAQATVKPVAKDIEIPPAPTAVETSHQLAAPQDSDGITQPEGNADPTPPQPTQAQQPEAHKSRRRANKFRVDPGSWNGVTELQTCGVTPDQIKAIQDHSSGPENKAIIRDYLKTATGYEQLSFLRADEAERLLEMLTIKTGEGTEDPRPIPDAADDTVECPMKGGDRLSISGYCRQVCDIRQREKWCPICGDDPPATGGGLI